MDNKAFIDKNTYSMSTSSDSNDKKIKMLYGVIAALAVLIVIMGVLLSRQKTDNVMLVGENTTLTVERNDLEQELQEMLTQYDALTVDNDQLSAEIIQQKEEIAALMEKVSKLNKDDKNLRWEISKLKKEAGTLRDIMKGYLYTIDSLNQKNKVLTDENSTLSTNLSTVTTENNQLQSTVQNQGDMIKTGSVIPSMNMVANGLRVKSSGKQEETNRASRAEMVRACCTLGENRITKAGSKTVYMRIISPEGVVLEDSNSPNATFRYDGVTGKYSARRDFNYENKPQELCVFYTVGEELSTGQYIVELYEAEALIGKTSFDLR